MKEVYKNLFIGNENDYEQKVKNQLEWRVVHACKEPYHRQLLGYTGRAAPKGHPEYLIAMRGNRLFLNIVDADSPDYIPKEIINKALEFIHESILADKPCLVHCNLGESRSPSIGLLYLAKHGHISNSSFSIAESEFRKLFPMYNPNNGIRGFIINNWGEYVK